MIEYIKGQVVEKTPTYVIIETAAGLAYHINTSLHTSTQITTVNTTKVYIYYYVKDEVHSLYGFGQIIERTLFTQLISVSGVGPATAQTMLSTLSPQEIQEAIIAENITIIKSIKGIGPKTAKRIILELKDKMLKISGLTPATSAINATANYREEALNALLALGISKAVAQKALNKVIRTSEKSIDSVEILIKMALQAL
jgi:Holliday junction DNA helicase RuvA